MASVAELTVLFFCVFYVWNQSYQWLKDKIVSEDGRKQQAKLKELSHIAEKLSCTLPQLAVGETKPKNPHLPRSLVFHRTAYSADMFTVISFPYV